MKIKEDFNRYSIDSFIKGLATVLFNPNFHAILLYRIAHTLSKVKLFIPICKIIMYINRVLYSIDIDYRADLAGGLKIVHGVGIIIGYDVRTEGPVTIYQGVTLGGNQGKKRLEKDNPFHSPGLERMS